MIQPLETAVVEIDFIKRRIALVHQVEVADAVLHSLIHRIIEQVPAQAFVIVPFPVLAEIAAHEQQLFARMGIHKAVIGAQVGKLLPFVARHFA